MRRVASAILTAALAWPPLLAPSLASASGAPEGARPKVRDDREAPAYREHPVTARFAGNALFGSLRGVVPIDAYGIETAFGVPLGSGPLTVAPAIRGEWLWGSTKYGLAYSLMSVGFELEFRPRGAANWFRVSVSGNIGQFRVDRARGSDDIRVVAAHLNLMLSADVLQIGYGRALWVGVVGRLDFPSVGLLVGLRF